MSNSATQSPLGINVLGSVLGNTGLHQNPVFTGFAGTSAGYEIGAGYANGGPYTPGSLVESTSLRLLTYAINQAYIGATVSGTVSNVIYNNLISIGSTSVPAFGNSPPATYTQSQSTGYRGVSATWAPTGWGGADQYTRLIATDTPNSVTAWGFTRLLALQSANEWNYNDSQPQYGDFLYSYNTISGFITSSNSNILASKNAMSFLDGVYSNMNDLITGDIAGVSLSTLLWGQDMIKCGNAIDLSTVDTFGLPSNLLKTLRTNNALSDSLIVVLLASGLTSVDIESILDDEIVPTQDMERNMWAAYTVITGQDLNDILIPLNCKTEGLQSLADLLNPAKLFPNSYSSLTVPIYNTERGPTNSKTYYPIYDSSGGINTVLYSPSVANKIGAEPIIPAPGNADRTSTSDVQEALQELKDSLANPFATSQVNSVVSPYNPITTIDQSTTRSVVDVIPQVLNESSAESIASGSASSPDPRNIKTL